MSLPEPESPSPLDAFIEQYEKDKAAKQVRPLAEYLSSFPGDEQGIADARFSSPILWQLNQFGVATIVRDSWILGDRKSNLEHDLIRTWTQYGSAPSDPKGFSGFPEPVGSECHLVDGSLVR